MNNDVFCRVQVLICDALAVDEREVKPDTSLVFDLGAESIDLLDIAFLVEKEFGITAGRDAFFPGHVLTDERFVRDGVLTEAGLGELRSFLPHVAAGEAFAKWSEKPKVADFPAVLSVGDVCRYVERQIQPEQAS